MTGAHSYTRMVMSIMRVNADDEENTGQKSRGASFTDRMHKRAVAFCERHGLCEIERSDERCGDLRVWYARLTEKGRGHAWGKRQGSCQSQT